MPRRTRHSELCAAVRRLLEHWGCVVVPVKQMATPGLDRHGHRYWRGGALKVGAADVLACNPSGRFIAVEVKIGRDRLRPAQEQFMGDVLLRGGVALVVRDTVDELLKRRKEVCGDDSC